MDYGRATSKLIEGVTLKDLAKETGVSHGLLRLSRLDPENPSHRNPPKGWETAVLRLARRRLAELSKLVEQLEVAPKKSLNRKRTAKRLRRR